MASEEHLAKLKEGVANWNEWRMVFEGRPDLTEANLSGADLRDANLSSVNLRGARLNSAKLNNANLSNADLRDVNLNKANLRKANLQGAHLREAILNYADLHSANLSKANLSYANLNKANLSYANLCHTNLYGANLSYADLRKADLHHAHLTEANLKGVYLNNANLSSTDLHNADLSNADLHNADFNTADLSGANLNHANLTSANLSGAFLRTAQVLGSNLTAVTLTGACTHDWKVNSATQLDSVICEYIYLKAEWSKDEWHSTDRRPDNPDSTLAPGEFAKLFQTELETVELVFVDGIDWKAFVLSFRDLQSHYNNELSIQAIEQKSGGAFVVRLSMLPDLDKTAIKNRAKDLYARECQLLETQYRAELHAQDCDIERYRREGANLLAITQLLSNHAIEVEPVIPADEQLPS